MKHHLEKSKADLLDQKRTLDIYLEKKHKAQDYHAVQDAASDIREIVTKIEMIDELVKLLEG